MGLDLTLLPFADDTYSHTVLSCRRDSPLFDFIETLPSLDVPPNFNSYLSRDDKYEESHYGLTIKDAYGEQLKYTTVKELLSMSSEFANNLSNKNKAVLAYLACLPNETKVALYWC